MFGLTTCHGTVLYLDRDQGLIRHGPLGEVDPADLLLVEGGAEATFRVREAHEVTRAVDIGRPARSRPTGHVSADTTVEDGLARFRLPTGYLAAPPDGSIRVDSVEAQLWECFGLVTIEAMEDLIYVAQNDWIRVGGGDRVERYRIGLDGAVRLRVDNVFYPIAGNFPLSGRRDGQGRIILFREGWMVEELKLFRPLVYFVLMGGSAAYLEQLEVATDSLVTYGGYDRDVLIITDRPHESIYSAVPATLHARLSFLDIQSSDKVDAVLARLMLAEHPGAAEHAPILYSDTDVVFDRPVLSFFEEVVLSGRMSAQTEPWNELTASACGGELSAADPTPMRHPHGFNAGVWAMPGGADSVQVVQTIRRAISAYLEINGRDSLPWLDQAMANYVLRKIDAFDPALIDRATRLCQQYEELDAGSSTGFVHFWPVGHRAEERVAAMRAYVERLQVQTREAN